MKTNKLYFRTFSGWLSKVYSKQKNSSKRRGHQPPQYSKEELEFWIKSQINYIEVFSNWEASGFEKYYVPSIDRIKNDIGYNLNNIRLTYWNENKTRYEKGVLKGIEKGKSKPVFQIDKITGKIINEFKSSSEAQRLFGFHSGHIRSCCNGKLKNS